MVTSSFGPVVTVSATYGSGGSVIAPRLAQYLGVPFIDRVISAQASDDAARQAHSEEALGEGEEATSPAGRILSYFARAASVGTMMMPDPLLEGDDSIRTRLEAELTEVAEGAPAVVLGRAGAVVLAARPRAFHVRLDGPVDRRVKWASSHEEVKAEDAARRQAETDRARTGFVKRLYRVDPTSPALYHLVLDPTVLGIDLAFDVVARAASAFFEANP
jgi:cytidylate kinase